MDEDEEVDIIGNYDDISKISSGQLLSCDFDYTVHPNWGNENSDGNFWSDSVPKHENLESNVQVLQSEEVIIEQPQKLMVYDWMNNEDELIFEEDIPASIEEVVEVDTINTVSSPTTNCSESCNTFDEQCFDDWELAAFETHPPAKNAKYIGPTNPRSLLKVKIESPDKLNCSSFSRNGTNNDSKASISERPVRKFKQTFTVNSSLLLKRNIPQTKTKRTTETVQSKLSAIGKSKFWQKIKMRPSNLKNEKLGLKIRQPNKMRKSKRKQNHKNTNFGQFGENITTNHGFDPKSVQFISTETVVKLKNCDSESDVEIIDIEADVVNEDHCITLPEPKESSSSLLEPEKTESENNVSVKQENFLSTETFKDISEELRNSLQDITIPTEELHIDSSEILELEKYVHSEFFDNRITKTPEQYLRIRNHILSVWQSLKPNYVSKTAVRNGLKQAGDVNSISRIHRLLEQIGAINFGHQEVHFEFIRPLSDFVATLIQPPKNRSNSNSIQFANPINMERRQRVRMNSTIVDSKTDNIMNYTISHIQGVTRPDPPALNSQRNQFHVNNKQVMSELDLVKCLKFSKDNIPPFKVSITLSTLLCLHLHALSSDHEVMGFLGGHRSKYVGRNKISLTRYRPCRTSHQSGTTCEMCPVSQLEQSSNLTSEGYELLGWFHSHPLFPANPSRTDVQTQRVMQLQFDSANPLIGVILSCLNMSLKCMYIMPKDLRSEPSDYDLPYELDIDIIKDCTDFKNDVKDVVSMIAINNCDSILDIIEKFKSTSNTLLSQFGFKTELFFKDVFF